MVSTETIPMSKIQVCPRCKSAPVDWSPLRLECPCGIFVTISPKDKTVLHAWNAWVSRQRLAIRDSGYDAVMRQLNIIYPQRKKQEEE